MDKGVLLDRLGATGEDRMLLAKVWDRMQQARSRNIPAATDFLSPQQQILTRELLHLAGAAETEYVFLGGYPEAERRLALFLPDWLEAETAESESPIRCRGHRSGQNSPSVTGISWEVSWEWALSGKRSATFW